MTLKRLWDISPWILLFLLGIGLNVVFRRRAMHSPVPAPALHSEVECLHKAVDYIEKVKAGPPANLNPNFEFVEDCLERTKHYLLARALELEEEDG